MNILRTDARFTQGDIGASGFDLTIFMGTELVDLSTVTSYSATFKKQDGKIIKLNTSSIEVLDSINGKIRVKLGTSETSYPGNVLATIEFYGANNERVTSSRFTFYVINDLDDGSAFESTSEYPLYTQFLDAVMNEDLRIQNESQRQTNETLRNEEHTQAMLDVDSKISESNTTINNMNLKIDEANTTIQNTNTAKTSIETLELEVQTNENTRISNELNRQQSMADIESSWNNLTTQQQQDAEVVTARGSYLSLDDRLDKEPKYFWKETKSIMSGGNTFTLTNSLKTTDELLIYDTTYNAIWQEGQNWNKSGQNIVFTSNMPENLSFKIFNLG